MNVLNADTAKSKDNIGITPQMNISDKGGYKGIFHLTKWEFDEKVREKAEAMLASGASIEEMKATFKDAFVSHEKIGENLLLNEGINELWTLVAGGGGTAYNNSNSYIGVGDSSTAASASQTGLQASTNKLYKVMDGSYPTYGTSQQIVFRATFGSSDANFAWNEFTVANGNSDSADNLNRLVSAQGTKTSGQTWQVTLTITLS